MCSKRLAKFLRFTSAEMPNHSSLLRDGTRHKHRSRLYWLDFPRSPFARQIIVRVCRTHIGQSTDNIIQYYREWSLNGRSGRIHQVNGHLESVCSKVELHTGHINLQYPAQIL